MMKKSIRILSILLVLSTLFSTAAYAAEGESNWVSFLDYDLGSDNSNYISFKTTGTLTYQLPYATFPRYLQGVVQCNSDNLSSMTYSRGTSSTRYGLTLIPLGNGLYRFYSESNGLASDTWSLHFNSTSSSTVYVEVVEFEYSLLLNSNYSDVGSLTINSGSSTSSYSMSSPSSAIYHYFDKGVETTYLAKATCPDWKKYDYITFFFYVYDLDINSISGRLGSFDVPTDFDYVESNDFSVMERYSLMVTLDLSDVDRNTTDIPYVEISGLRSGLSDLSSFFGLLSVSGNITVEEVDLLPQLLKRYFAELGGKLDDLNFVVSDFYAQTYALMMDHYRQILEDVELGFSTIAGQFDSYFQALESRLINQHDQIIELFGEWKDSWYFFWDDFYLYWQDMLAFWDDVSGGFAALIGNHTEGDDLSDVSSDLNDQMTDIHDFEQSQQEVLDQNIGEIKDSVSFTEFTSSLSFVSHYIQIIWLNITDYGNFTIIFTLPIFIGIFFFVCGRLPGATRWNYRPPRKDGVSK